MTSLAAVVAHPDDESLIAGGTLALAASGGALTGALSLTRGEHGPISDPALATAETLGEVRAGELGAAAAALGLGWWECLELPDGEVPWCEEAAVAGRIAELLRRHRVDAVLTFGEDGLYGHPDHVATRHLVGLAVERLGAAAPSVYEAAWGPQLVPALAAAVAERGLPGDLWGLEPEDFGSEEPATVEIDVRAVLARKLAGIRAHRTQLAEDHLLHSLPEELAARFLGVEPWRLAVSGARGDVLGELARGSGR